MKACPDWTGAADADDVEHHLDVQRVVFVLFHTKGHMAPKPQAKEYVSFRGNTYTEDSKGEVREILLWQRTSNAQAPGHLLL